MLTEEVKKRFQNPQNAGVLEEYNAEGNAKGDDCSDFLVIRIKIEEGIIRDAKFQVQGCPGAICTADVFIDLVKGLSIQAALQIEKADISKALGIFPGEYLHCAKLSIVAFKKAVRAYQPKIIAVSGGKGGTGKSTVATALAYELAKKYKVLLVDADVDCPNDHLLLNIERKLLNDVSQRIPVWDNDKCDKCGVCSTVCKSNAIVAIEGKFPIFVPTQCNGCGACVLRCPNRAIGWDEKVIGWVSQGTKHGIDLLSGELKTNEPVSEFIVNALNKIIEKKKANYDYIIVDTAAGTHCPVIAAFEVCDIVLAVTEPTPLGKHDLELILRLADMMKIKADIILNRADIGDKKLIEKLAEKYLKKIIFEIPYSKDIARQYSKGEPLEIADIDKVIINQ